MEYHVIRNWQSQPHRLYPPTVVYHGAKFNDVVLDAAKRRKTKGFILSIKIRLKLGASRWDPLAASDIPFLLNDCFCEWLPGTLLAAAYSSEVSP